MALPPRFVPLNARASAAGGGGGGGEDLSSILSRLAPLGGLTKGIGKLTDIPGLTNAGTGISGLLGLTRGIAGGDPGQAIGGAANLGSGIASLAGLPGIASGLGALGGPLTLATGLAKGDPLSSILGGVQTGSMVSGALGGPTISSGLSALAGLLPGAEAGAAGAAGAAGSIAPGIGGAGWMLNPAMGMGGMMLMGGLMGKQADAEASARAFKESRDALNASVGQMRQVHQLGETAFTAPQLPGTLSLLHDTLRDAPNLGLYTHTGRTDISAEEGDRTNAAIQRMRAEAGQDWLRGLEAANAQGMDLTGEGGALQSPFRGRAGGGPTTLNLEGGYNVGINNDQNINLRQLAHLLDITEAEAKELQGAVKPEGGSIAWGGVLNAAAGDPNSLLGRTFGPDRLAMLKDRIGFDPTAQGGNLDPEKVNKLLDEQWLTSTVHDAVRDVGLAKGMTHEQLAQAGIAPGSWQGMAGGSVYGGGMNTEGLQMPSYDELAAFPGAGTGLSGLLTQARGILGDDWGGGQLDAPYVNQWDQDLDWTGMPKRKPVDPYTSYTSPESPGGGF